jgi:hypothetical protein
MTYLFFRAWFFLLFFGMWMVACKGGPDRTAGSGPDSVKAGVDSPGIGGEMDSLQGVVPADRPTLIAALKAMGRRLGSGDKQQIAGIFSFPISDSVAHFYLDDTTFSRERERDSAVTEEMFGRYFTGINKSVDFGEFGQVFRELNVEKLAKTNGLEIRTDTVTEPCTRRYRIEVEGDTLVRISYGVSSVNENYKPPTKKEKDDNADDYEEGACEHVTFWVFGWDGQRLRLRRQDAAD